MAPGTVTVKVNDKTTIIGKAQPASKFITRALDIFYGIRYASSERYKAPVAVPLDAVTGEINATKKGPLCPIPMAVDETSEDSLRVNIIRPSVPASDDMEGDGVEEKKKIPVVVYFHGGGFNFGNPLDNNLASFVARSKRDILSVSVGYRLGALGFGPGDGNIGLRDQRAAVEWVKQWIGTFGGDEDYITLMGVSAGAHSVGHHILNPAAIPYRKAILESGSPTARSVLHHTHPRPTAQLASFHKQLKPAGASLDDILNASIMTWAKDMDSLCWPFQPLIDGDVIPDMPLKLWRQPDIKSRLPPTITGFCAHEGADFVPTRRPLPTLGAFFQKLVPGIDVDALEAMYPAAAPSDTTTSTAASTTSKGHLKRLYEAYGHYAYICPIIHTAHMISQAGGGPVYLYEFAAQNDLKKGTAGHCAHTGLVRPQAADIGSAEGLQAISEAMHSRWTKFIGSPDGKLNEDEWPAFETPFGKQEEGREEGEGTLEGKGKLLVFGEGNNEACGGGEKGVAVRTRSLTRREREVCRFWWDRMELSQGMGVKGAVEAAW